MLVMLSLGIDATLRRVFSYNVRPANFPPLRRVTYQMHRSIAPGIEFSRCPSMVRGTIGIVGLLIGFVHSSFAADLDYGRDIKPILTKYCVGCHGERDNESKIMLDSFRHIMAGGPEGAILVPGNAKQSRMAQVLLEDADNRMPPSESLQPTRQEVELIFKWIEQSAKGSDEVVPLKSILQVKSIPSKINPQTITALARGPNDSLFVGRYNSLHLVKDQWSNSLPVEVVGKVTQIRTSSDGRFTTVVSGVAGVGGRAIVMENVVGSSLPKLIRVLDGHRDTLYTGALSPDGSILATGGYDRVVMLWDMKTGDLLRTLQGHNGAIYDLDFDATGKVLASASADETIKVWRVDTGERLDTFGQCEAEQFAVRFDSPRNRIIAVGADRRIRVWNLLSMDKPTVSPMLYSVFAHESPITFFAPTDDGQFLATASEDRQVKLWRADDVSPLGLVGTLDDCPSGLSWNSKRNQLIASCVSGRLSTFDVTDKLSKLPRTMPLATESNAIAETGSTVSSKLTEVLEDTTNHTPGTAQPLSIPCQVTAVLRNEDNRGDHSGDWYSFAANANEPLVIKIDASRSGSPLDSFIDVLTSSGEPILRTRLQALRESYFTFRGKDSTNIDDFRLHRWEDMELNELLYAGGEVVKLWLYPRGPDSGFKTYPGFGNRFTYIDTTATTHALNEPAWIVRELGSNEAPVPNGLPVFPVYYSNDDDGNRKFGKDSCLTFTPKSSGTYLIRVRDARGQSGDNYSYKLSVARPSPRFDFRVEQKEITLRPGVGTEFSVVVDRFEGCDGEIEIGIEGVPDSVQLGLPLTIEAGQHRAIGMLHSPSDLATTTKEFKMQFKCRTKVDGRVVEGDAGADQREITVKVSDKKAMLLKVVGKGQGAEAAPISELTIHPGETISANLVIDRGGLEGDIAFGGDDSGRNLPYGCYVDNIGLSGLLIPAGQSVREFFITASPVTTPQTRLFHLRANVDGNPTTVSIRINVSK
jgi:WD40 repeat protein